MPWSAAGLEAEVGVPARVAEQDDRRLPAEVGGDEHGGHERRADALALVVGVHGDRAERRWRAPPHRRAAGRRGARRPRRAGRRPGSGRRGRRPRRAAGRGCASRAACSAPSGTPKARSCRHPGGLEVVRALAAQDEVTVHGGHPVSTPRARRASTARSGRRGPLARPRRRPRPPRRRRCATSRRAARREGATCEDHTTSRPPGAAPSAPRQRRAARKRRVEACTRKSGPVVDVEEHDVPGPAWPAPPASTSSTSATCRGTAPLEARQLGDQPGAGPADQRRRELDDVGVPHPRVREHRAGRHPQAQPADEHPARERVPPQGALGERDLGARCRRCPSRRRRRRRARAPRPGGAARPRRAGCRPAPGSPPRGSTSEASAQDGSSGAMYGRRTGGHAGGEPPAHPPVRGGERPSEAVETQLAVVEADGLTRARPEGGVGVVVVARHASTSRPWPPRSAPPRCCGSGADPCRPG